MADQKVTDLAVASTPLSGTEIVYLVQGGLDTQATVQDVLNASSNLISVVAGENITVDNTSPQNPIIASSGQSDPNFSVIGTGILGDEFRYNEVVVVQSNTAYSLTDADIYKTFITDGSTPCDYDFSSVSQDFTCKFHVDARNPALIRLVYASIWASGIQYTSEIQSDSPSASMTVRMLSNRLNCYNIAGIWKAI
jgi:hypothetical protein